MAITLQLPFPLVPSSATHTTGDLNYYVPPTDGERPYYRLYDSDLPRTNVFPQARNTPIYDLRPLLDAEGQAGKTTVTGFQALGKQIAKTNMTEDDWQSDATIQSKYYSEVDSLLKKVTGASRTVIFDHTIRRREAPGHETPDTPENRKPVALVHVDQTQESGRKRVFRHTGEDAARLLQGKAQLINVWRPIGRNPVLDAPLAVADARSLAKSDLIPSRLIYQGLFLRVKLLKLHSPTPIDGTLFPKWKPTKLCFFNAGITVKMEVLLPPIQASWMTFTRRRTYP